MSTVQKALAASGKNNLLYFNDDLLTVVIQSDQMDSQVFVHLLVVP